MAEIIVAENTARALIEAEEDNDFRLITVSREQMRRCLTSDEMPLILVEAIDCVVSTVAEGRQAAILLVIKP